VNESAASDVNYVTSALEFFAALGTQEAIVDGDNRFSYADTRAAVLGMAAALRAHGVRPGSCVAAVIENRYGSIFLQLALHLLGCRTGFVATYAPLRDQLDFLEYAAADVLIHDSDVGAQLIKEIQGHTTPPLVLSLGPGGAGPDLLAGMTAAMAEGAQPFDSQSVTTRPEALFYTSGTTGQPKLVLHRHRFYQALFAGGQLYRSIGEPPMRHLGIPAFSTTSGQMPALLALFQGGSIVLMENFDMATFLAMIERERITSTFIGPLRLYEMLQHPALPQTDRSSLRYLNCGASAPAPARLAEAIDLLGPVVRLVYGMTEMPLITDLPFLDHDPAHPERLSSCGTPFADCRVQIRDGYGAELPVGQTGEVWVSGSLIMDEYWRQPELTAQTVVDGWLHTGDIGYLDEDGFLYLVDRSKDVIITGRGDQKVYSRVVEDILVGHPGVRAAAVIGVPDGDLGEAVHAFVVPAAQAGAARQVTAGELRELVATRLKKLYAPREVEFVEALPLTPADKIDKKALKARYLSRPH
jgi:fatty-acyl-CoA synthase